MFAIVLLGAILILVPVLAIGYYNRGLAMGLCVVVGFLCLMIGLVWYAEYRPWIFDTSREAFYPYAWIGFITLIILGVIGFMSYFKLKDTFRPTPGTQKELEKELEMMTKLKDRQALICSLVPPDAEDPYTGKLATWQQLTDYRWCACWLAHNDRMKKIDDPAYWPHR